MPVIVRRRTAHRFQHIVKPGRIAERDHAAVASRVKRVALPVAHHSTGAFHHGDERGEIIQLQPGFDDHIDMAARDQPVIVAIAAINNLPLGHRFGDAHECIDVVAGKLMRAGGPQHCVGKVLAWRGARGLPVEGRPFADLPDPAFPRDRLIDNAQHRPAILHQGNQLNPYINYPFLTINALRAYISEAHAVGAKVKLYYTVRELSTSATELWALRSLGGEVIVPSREEGGHAWLKEHVRSNYSASWHERLSDGEVDASVHTPAFTNRMDNYWIEGILWLVRNLDIDGIYLDGAPYERSILRRLRAALEPLTAHRPNPFLLDLHASCAGNPHLPYAELYPYIDSVWFGEQCDYRSYSPEQWLAEASGVPFGLPGQVLGDNRDQWQALVFGMTCRIYPDPHRCNPRPLWAALDALGLQAPRMIGWWDPASPIAVHGAEQVKATLFVGANGVSAIAVANWAPRPATFTLAHAALATAGRAKLVAPPIIGFQPGGEWALGAPLTLHAKGTGSSVGFNRIPNAPCEGLLLRIDK